mgnify:CR=1 FL=1
MGPIKILAITVVFIWGIVFIIAIPRKEISLRLEIIGTVFCLNALYVFVDKKLPDVLCGTFLIIGLFFLFVSIIVANIPRKDELQSNAGGDIGSESSFS